MTVNISEKDRSNFLTKREYSQKLTHQSETYSYCYANQTLTCIRDNESLLIFFYVGIATSYLQEKPKKKEPPLKGRRRKGIYRQSKRKRGERYETQREQNIEQQNHTTHTHIQLFSHSGCGSTITTSIFRLGCKVLSRVQDLFLTVGLVMQQNVTATSPDMRADGR